MHYIREQEKEDWGHLAGRGGLMKKTHGPRKDVGSQVQQGSKARNMGVLRL